ncbi:MAG: hypothetical protein ACREMK_06150 [Gemmatimonadota bacterium]
MRITMSGPVTAGMIVLTAGSLVGQSADAHRAGERIVLPRAEEIALARSAAPPDVSRDATVLVFERGRGYRVATDGTNGVVCYVARSQPQALEPHCFDEEGARTVLQIHLREAELREEGMTEEEIELEIARGLESGELKLPRRPAMSYMLSSAQVLYNDEGERVGAWKPHLMLYWPYLEPGELGLSETPSLGAGMVVDPGTPLANLMVVVPEFVDPVAVERP